LEQETLFTAVKWDILKTISTKKSSPIELAEIHQTSLSNISQSLRFLELAGLVTSERVANRDKGLPRVVYSLTKDAAYIIAFSKSFADKRMIELDDRKKAYLRSWFYENTSLHYFLEKAIQALEEDLNSLEGIYFDTTSGTDVKIAVISKGAKKEYKETSAKYQGTPKKIKFTTTTSDHIHKNKHSFYPLHDPLKIFGGGL